MPEDLPDDQSDLNQPPSFFPSNFVEGDEEGSSTLIEVEVEGVYERQEGREKEHFVLVHHRGRKLPIIIDPCNAYSISLPLEGRHPERPLSHDLMKSLVDRLGGELLRVVIDDLWSTTYYAKLFIQTGGEVIEIDARPSDALALAIRCQSPIFVTEAIMESASEP